MSNPQIRRTKAYKVILSTGDPIKIEQEEIQKVLAGASQKSLIVVKSGMINPSYIVSVVEDTDRAKEWMKETQYGAYLPDGRRQGDAARDRGMRPLASIFDGQLNEMLRASSLKHAQELGMEVRVPELPEAKTEI